MIPIPIELISGRTNAVPWKIPEKFAQDHSLGQKLPSVRLVGALNASAISHQIGNSVHAMVIALAAVQLTFRPVGMAGWAAVRARRAVLAAGAATEVISASLQCSTGRGGAEDPDEDEGDDGHRDEDQPRDRRADPQVQRSRC